VRDALIVLVAWMISGGFFFSAQLTSGFDRVMGNAGDAQLMVYLNEQWFLVVKGSQPWRDPPFFYPVKGVLGYTDTFFLWQFFFAPFRILGADPFLAYQLTIVVLSLVAFVSFVVLVRWVFRSPLFVSIIGAIVFTFANNLSQHAGFGQLFGIYFVPPLTLLSVWTWRLRRSRPWVGRLLALSVGGAWGLLLFSTYYVAWLSILSAGLVALVMCLTSPRWALAAGRTALRSGWQCLLAGSIGFGLGSIPFFLTYLPVADQLGTRSYGYVMTFAPRMRDLVNVGPGSLLWAPVFQHVWSRHSAASYQELSYAITPLLELTIVIGVVAILWALVGHRARPTPVVRLTLSLCIAAIVLTLLPVDTPLGTGWAVVWHLPGAAAIRAIDRVEVANNFVTAMALVAVATLAYRRVGRRPRSTLLVGVGAVILCLVAIEQLHSSSATQLVRSRQIPLIESVPSNPPGCTSFYVIDSKPNTIPFYALQTRAMMISQRLDLPTLNGYSGDTPPNWYLLFPNSRSYLIFVKQWERAHGLTTGVCQLDLGTMTWQPGVTP
jgi:hypothetical protein